MIPYHRVGRVAERPHLNLPKQTFEEEIGLDGFFGPVSHLYHRNAPTGWKTLGLSKFQWQSVEEAQEPFLKPQCYGPSKDTKSEDFYSSKRLMFWNQDIQISTHKIKKSSPIYFRNADAHDLYFVHSGEVACESVFGELKARKGDYLVIPRGVTYRFSSKDSYLLHIESLNSYYKKPPTGILGQQALYHQEGISKPNLKQLKKKEKQSTVRVQKDGRLTEIIYPFDIRDVAGWMGDLYPYILPVSNIAPVMSPIAHLPPSINATWITDQFIVCTFLPRPLEEPKGALRVPFYHSNIDYDEVIFYHEGDFFSRDNMEAGCMTLHPRGINHGPHPKALANQDKKSRTDEIAVMVDTRRSLKVSSFARGLERHDYWKSWKS